MSAFGTKRTSALLQCENAAISALCRRPVFIGRASLKKIPASLSQGRQMRRREFITLIGGAVAAWPVGSQAQQSAKSTIGFLGSESPDAWAGRLQELQRGLSESGFVEGQNLSVEYRWAQGRNE